MTFFKMNMLVIFHPLCKAKVMSQFFKKLLCQIHTHARTTVPMHAKLRLHVHCACWCCILIHAFSLLTCAPITGHWQCHHWHFTDPSQNVWTKAKCLWKFPVWLSTTVFSITWPTPLHNVPKSPKSGAVNITDNTAAVCKTVRKRWKITVVVSFLPTLGEPLGFCWRRLKNLNNKKQLFFF